MKKDLITTIIALINMVIFAGLLAALIFDLIDKATFYEMISVLGATSITAIGYFAKDRDKQIKP